MSVQRKTISELMAENRVISAEEITRAMEYERSLLGDDFRYPRDGEIYEAMVDVECSQLPLWREADLSSVELNCPLCDPKADVDPKVPR